MGCRGSTNVNVDYPVNRYSDQENTLVALSRYLFSKQYSLTPIEKNNNNNTYTEYSR